MRVLSFGKDVWAAPGAPTHVANRSISGHSNDLARLLVAGLAKSDSRPLDHVSVMSPVVRQQLPPTSAPPFRHCPFILAQAEDITGPVERLTHHLIRLKQPSVIGVRHQAAIAAPVIFK